jgi:hypothetical protein
VAANGRLPAFPSQLEKEAVHTEHARRQEHSSTFDE